MPVDDVEVAAEVANEVKTQALQLTEAQGRGDVANATATSVRLYKFAKVDTDRHRVLD